MRSINRLLHDHARARDLALEATRPPHGYGHRRARPEDHHSGVRLTFCLSRSTFCRSSKAPSRSFKKVFLHANRLPHGGGGDFRARGASSGRRLLFRRSDFTSPSTPLVLVAASRFAPFCRRCISVLPYASTADGSRSICGMTQHLGLAEGRARPPADMRAAVLLSNPILSGSSYWNHELTTWSTTSSQQSPIMRSPSCMEAIKADCATPLSTSDRSRRLLARSFHASSTAEGIRPISCGASCPTARPEVTAGKAGRQGRTGRLENERELGSTSAPVDRFVCPRTVGAVRARGQAIRALPPLADDRYFGGPVACASA